MSVSPAGNTKDLGHLLKAMCRNLCSVTFCSIFLLIYHLSLIWTKIKNVKIIFLTFSIISCDTRGNFSSLTSLFHLWTILKKLDLRIVIGCILRDLASSIATCSILKLVKYEGFNDLAAISCTYVMYGLYGCHKVF